MKTGRLDKASLLPDSVMVVDDDAFVRTVVEGALRSAGVADVHVCASGSAALAAVATAKPGLILLDVVMSGMDGPATLSVLAARVSPLPPVIFLTARDDKEIGVDVSTVAGIIAKPFDPASLAGDIARILRPRGSTPRPATFQPAAKARRLAAVAEAFARNLPPTASRIESAWGHLQRGSWDRAQAEAVLAGAHSLAGSAGLFERHALSAAAHNAERLLLNALKLERSPDSAEMARLGDAVTALIAACRPPADA